MEIWMKEVLPKTKKGSSAALVFLNRRTDGTPVRVSVVLRDLGLTSMLGYQVKELFDGLDLGFYRPDDAIKVEVNPTGNDLIEIVYIVVHVIFYCYYFTGVVMIKCTAQSKKIKIRHDLLDNSLL